MARAHFLVARPAQSNFPQRLLQAVKSAWLAYWTHRARKAAILALHTLDDRTLKDIGVDRSEIESVVYTQDYGRQGSNGRRITIRLGAAGRS